MAANDAKPEVQKTVPPTDASEAAKARTAQEAYEKLLHDSQAKPLTPKEKTTLSDTEQLAHGIIKAFTDKGKTVPEANKALNDFVNAKDDAGRAKVFTDANVTAPDVVQAYEAKYGAGTSDAIRSSVLLAKRVEQEQKAPTVERPQPTDARIPAPAPAPKAADASPATILNNANDTIAKSIDTLKAVQADGKPLPDSSKQIFQAAIDAASKITPGIIDAQKKELYDSVPGWTQAKEDQYHAVHKAFADASKNLSPDAQAKLAKMPEGSSPAAQLAAVESMTNDPSAMKLKQADADAQNFYKANPGAHQRDDIDINEQLGLLSNLSHGKAFASAVYAEALAATGNAGDIPQAKAMMTEAAKDRNLTDVIPGIQKEYDAVMSAGGPAAPAEDPLDKDKTVPGWAQTKAAMVAMSDQSLSPEQRMVKAAPLFENALKAAKSINPDDIDKAKLDIGRAVSGMTNGRALSLADLDKKENGDLVKEIMDDPAKKSQINDLVKQNALLDIQRLQNVNVSEAYAQSLSKTASDLQAQANREPANSSRFNGEANAMTTKAATVLQSVGQVDSNFGVAVDSADNPAKAQHQATLNQHRIAEEIAQVNRGEAIDPAKAASKTSSQSAVDAINDSIMGHTYKFETALFGQQIDGSVDPLKAIRPFSIGLNATIEGLDAVRHVPVLGIVPGVASDFTKGWAPSPESAMAGAVEDAAKAKVANPEAAKSVIEDKKHEVLGNAVGVGADVFSGQAGLQAERLATSALGKAAPEIAQIAAKVLPGMEETAVKAALESGNWKIKLGAAATVGVAAAFGSRWAADEISHDLLGTKKMSLGEIASHSTLSLASAYTARTLSEKLPADTGSTFKKFSQTALTSGTTSTVFGLGEVNPFLTDKATGQRFTAADTLINAGENMAFGGTAGMAGRVLSPFVHMSTIGLGHQAIGVVQGVGKFVFNSEAGKEVVADTAAAAATVAKREMAPVFAKATTGFMGTSLGSAALRGGVGTGLGAAGSFVAVNPWETNDATGKNYTVGETAASAVEWGLGTGAALAASRYPFAAAGIGYRAAANALPGEGSTLGNLMGTNLIATGERFGVGGTVGFAGSLTFGDKADANGKDYTFGQNLYNASISGLEFGTGFAAAPPLYKYAISPVVRPFAGKIGDGVNFGRRFLGRTAEGAGSSINTGINHVAGEGTVIGDKIVAPVVKVVNTATTAATDAVKEHGPGIKQNALAFSLPVSTSLSGFYENHELKKLDKKSDARAEQLRKDPDSEPGSDQ